MNETPRIIPQDQGELKLLSDNRELYMRQSARTVGGARPDFRDILAEPTNGIDSDGALA